MLLPGWAVQVTVRGALVMVAPPTLTGLGSGATVTVAVQPGTGLVEMSVNGRTWGSVMISLTVLAVSDSSGTRNVSWASCPEMLESGKTFTWAPALVAVPITAAAT